MSSVLATLGAAVDEPAARSLLQRAQGATQKWPEDFAGFRARIRVRALGRESVGLVTVRTAARAPAGVEVALPEDGLEPVAAEVLGQLAEQLRPRFFKDGDGRYPVSLGAADGHPLGRLVQVWRPGDEVVRYRIDEKCRVRLEECQGGGRRAVSTMVDYVRATPGRVLPGHVETASWDLQTGARLRREEVLTTWCRLAHAWLPVSRCARIEAGRDRHAVLVELCRHKLL